MIEVIVSGWNDVRCDDLMVDIVGCRLGRLGHLLYVYGLDRVESL